MNERLASRLSADQPITKPADDRLGYSSFAEHLAEVLVNSLPDEGFVVAINAPWGAGKTTVLNLVQDALEARPEAQRPLILRFNPWWFSGQDLTLRFFQELLAFTKPTRFGSVRKPLATFAGVISPALSVIPGYGQGSERRRSSHEIPPPRNHHYRKG